MPQAVEGCQDENRSEDRGDGGNAPAPRIGRAMRREASAEMQLEEREPLLVGSQRCGEGYTIMIVYHVRWYM
jgi:hypothetical protein